MKKFILFAVLALGFTACADAQTKNPERISKASTDTSLNADTVIVSITGMPSSIKGIQAAVKRLTGTTAGIVIIQGTIDGTNWVNISGTSLDTLTLSNQAFNTKVWPMTTTSFFSYRLWYKSTGTQTSTITLSYMRRPDE